MTLTAEQSINKAKYEAAPTSEIIDIIRTAMGQGCIRPCHVYDAVDELICRVQDLENRLKSSCDVRWQMNAGVNTTTNQQPKKRNTHMNINETKTANGADQSAQKSHAEIIAECYHNTASTRYVRELLDRLEAAHRRECGDYAALREAVEKTNATLREALEILNGISDEEAGKLNSRIEDVADAICEVTQQIIPDALAATEQEVGSDGTNNNSRAREVLNRVHEFLSNLCRDAKCDDHCSECIDASDLADDVYDLLHAPATGK